MEKFVLIVALSLLNADQTIYLPVGKFDTLEQCIDYMLDTKDPIFKLPTQEKERKNIRSVTLSCQQVLSSS